MLQHDASVCSCWFCPCATLDLARSFFHSNACILFILGLEDYTAIKVFIPRAGFHLLITTAIKQMDLQQSRNARCIREPYMGLLICKRTLVRDARIVAFYSNTFS